MLSRNSQRCAALFVTLAALAPSDAAIIDATTSGFTLENSIRVPTDAETAWRALIDGVDRW